MQVCTVFAELAREVQESLGLMLQSQWTYAALHSQQSRLTVQLGRAFHFALELTGQSARIQSLPGSQGFGASHQRTIALHTAAELACTLRREICRQVLHALKRLYLASAEQLPYRVTLHEQLGALVFSDAVNKITITADCKQRNASEQPEGVPLASSQQHHGFAISVQCSIGSGTTALLSVLQPYSGSDNSVSWQTVQGADIFSKFNTLMKTAAASTTGA